MPRSPSNFPVGGVSCNQRADQEKTIWAGAAEKAGSCGISSRVGVKAGGVVVASGA